MNIYRIIILLAVVYFTFYLLRALITGEAQVFRKRSPSTRRNNPKEYWGFVAFMAACVVFGLFIVLAGKN